MQPNFRGNKQQVLDRCLKGLSELSEELDFDLYHVRNLVSDVEHTKSSLKELESHGIDLLLILNASFASGYLAQALFDFNGFLGFWAVPEEGEKGPLPLNSLCGMNLNVGLLRKKKPHRKFKWFYGYPDQEIFKKRLFLTVKALGTIKRLRGKRILQVEGWAPGFDNLSYESSDLYNHFGVIVERISFEELKKMILSQKSFEKTIDQMKKHFINIDDLSKQSLPKAAALIDAVKELREEGYEGFAISCWPYFRTYLSMVPCASFGFLNDLGITVACEGDVYGALSMLILRYLAECPSLIFDISHIDVDEDLLLFWHCGLGSKCYSDKLWMERHFNPGPFDPQKGWLTMAPVASMVIDKMPVTVMRVCGDGDKIIFFKGEFFGDSKPSFDGSRGWFGRMSFAGKKLGVMDLINTIMTYGLEHHFCVVKEDWEEELFEFAYWSDLKILEPLSYKNYPSKIEGV